MNEIVGNDRRAALARLDEKAEAAFSAWSEGDMPDDLYNHRMAQIREQRARIEADVALFERAREEAGA